MLRSAVPARRAATTALRPLRTANRFAYPVRQISFIPWRRQNAAAPLPVYFPKPPRKPRLGNAGRRIGRIVFTTFIIYTCWQVFASVVIDPLLDWAESEWDSLSEKEKQEVENQAAEEDEPLLFLPFPFTTKEVKQPPYKGSDPEWQTFLSVNKDPKIQKEVQYGLAEYIRRGIEKHPEYSKLLGGKDIKVRKFWLDIIYPNVPPPKTYVSGIIVDDEGIFWGDKAIDPMSASYLNNILYPKVAAATAWSFFSTLATQTALDVGKFFGFGGSSSEQADTTWHSVILSRMKEKEGGAPPEKTMIQPPPRPPTISINANGDISTPGGVGPTDTRMAAALQAAGATFAKGWKPVKQPPGRGCIRVDGLVELQGPNACMAVYALAWYDPKQKTYSGIQIVFKHLLQHKQKPAQG